MFLPGAKTLLLMRLPSAQTLRERKSDKKECGGRSGTFLLPPESVLAAGRRNQKPNRKGPQKVKCLCRLFWTTSSSTKFRRPRRHEPRNVLAPISPFPHSTSGPSGLFGVGRKAGHISGAPLKNPLELSYSISQFKRIFLFFYFFIYHNHFSCTLAMRSLSWAPFW